MKNLHQKENIKTVIVTGGNTGLGYECAKEIAGSSSENWHIILACRNPEKAAGAVKRLIAETGNKQIEAMELDLASLSSVRRFAKDFSARRVPLDALVCNAGLQIVSGTTYTQDGFETTFGVNHLGHFLLANILLKDLQSPGRVIFVSSDTHDPSKKAPVPPPVFQDAELLAHPITNDKKANSGTIGRTRYSTSKLCNILCAYELSRRLQTEQQNKEITVNAFNPGLMAGTGLGSDYSLPLRFVWNVVLPALGALGVKVRGSKLNNLDDSGKALARLVTDSRYAGVTGKYFDIGKEIPSSDESYDRHKAYDLWEGSSELVKLTPEETIFSVNADAWRANIGRRKEADNQTQFLTPQTA